MYWRLRKLRNRSTHRFVIAHEADPPESSEVIERVSLDDLRRADLAALKLTRAAAVTFTPWMMLIDDPSQW